MNYAYFIAATLLAYLIGSLSFAVIVSRAVGLQDPRSYGSKNPGATNVLRSGSKAAAVATLLLDGAKGWLPVVLVKWFGGDYGLGDGTVAAVALAAAVLAPAYYLLGDRGAWYLDKSILAVLMIVSALLLYRHRENIDKLLKGTESKIGGSSPAKPDAVAKPPHPPHSHHPK